MASSRQRASVSSEYLKPGSRNHFAMRSYQIKPYLAKKRGCLRFVERLHRRAGKDRNWMNITVISMLERVGNYIHVFPALNMGRRDIWENMIHETRNGVEYALKMTDMFPPELIKRRNEAEMLVELINGSTWQIMGADDEDSINRLRGPNPIGIVLSEYAFMNPKVDTVLQPVLAENNGWIAYISTPNIEDDEFDKLCRFAESRSDWFFQSLNVEQTVRDAEGEDGGPVVPQSKIQEFRDKGTREEEIQREYYCNTKGYRHGTIYGDLISTAYAMNRIGRFAYIPQLPVGLCLDLGHSDAMAVWFYQRPNPTSVYWIDYHEAWQKDNHYIARFLREDRRYMYGRMCLPHDGKDARDFYEAVGFRNIEVAKKPTTVQHGINEVREKFGQFYFDEIACARGIECLAKYKYEWDDDKKVFDKNPMRSEYNHGADALRSGVACGFDPLEFIENMGRPIKVETSFDPTSFFSNEGPRPW